MTFLRAIRDDLVEKKLWPVAVALLLALVAIPVLLARGGEQPVAPILPDPNAAAAPVVGNTTPDPVVLAEASRRRVQPTGRFKDPFRAATGAAPKDEAAVAVDGAAVTVTPEEPAAAGGTAAPGDTGAAVSDGVATAVIEPDDPVSSEPVVSESVPADAADRHFAGYRVDLDWGPAADPETERDVPRLQALEVADVPQIVFMGVRPDGRTALFLLVGDVAGSGDARCRPSEEFCSLLEMRAGDTQFLDIVTDDGVRQYELHVAEVDRRHSATAAAAEERLERVSKAGRRLVKETIEGGRTFVRRYVYSEKLGVLKFVEDDEQQGATRGALEPAE